MTPRWWVAATLIAVATTAAAQCSVDHACYGRQVTRGDGTCTNLTKVCDDKQTCTLDTCSSDGLCQFTTQSASCLKCMSTCTPQCDAKECGNDGCGSFCGICPEGQGCDTTFKCTSTAVAGSCTAPLSLIPNSVDRILSTTATYTISGDTSAAGVTHILTPLCNFRSASPELIFSFIVPTGKTIGYEIRTVGFDTVLSLMKGACRTNATISCNDDATPPGNYGSSISGSLTAGTYYLQVDGYDSTALGPFNMTAKFVENCVPKCDGSFC